MRSTLRPPPPTTPLPPQSSQQPTTRRRRRCQPQCRRHRRRDAAAIYHAATRHSPQPGAVASLAETADALPSPPVPPPPPPPPVRPTTPAWELLPPPSRQPPPPPTRRDRDCHALSILCGRSMLLWGPRARSGRPERQRSRVFSLVLRTRCEGGTAERVRERAWARFGVDCAVPPCGLRQSKF